MRDKAATDLNTVLNGDNIAKLVKQYLNLEIPYEGIQYAIYRMSHFLFYYRSLLV